MNSHNQLFLIFSGLKDTINTSAFAPSLSCDCLSLPLNFYVCLPLSWVGKCTLIIRSKLTVFSLCRLPANAFATIGYFFLKARVQSTDYLQFWCWLRPLLWVLLVNHGPSYIAWSTCPHTSASCSLIQLRVDYLGKGSFTVVHPLLRYGACRFPTQLNCLAAFRCLRLRSYGLFRCRKAWGSAQLVFVAN